MLRARKDTLRRSLSALAASHCRDAVADRAELVLVALERLEQVAELLALRAQVLRVDRIRRREQRDLVDELDAVAAESRDLLRVVGQEAHLAHAEVAQDLGAE